MKNVFFKSLALLFLTTLFFSCETPMDYSLDFDEIQLNGAVIPEAVYDFLDENFPEYTTRKIKTEDICADSLIFEAELEKGPEGDIDVYFKEDGSFWFTASKISLEDVPEEVLAQVDSIGKELVINPNDVEVWEIDVDSILIKFELRSKSQDLDALISLTGEVVCLDDDSEPGKGQGKGKGKGKDDDGDDDDGDDDGDDDDGDDDGDDDDDKIAPGNIPDDILDFIKEQYPSYQIKKAKKEDICDDVKYYAVEIEEGMGPDMELFFTLDWTFQFEYTKVDVSALTDDITDVIDRDFEGYTIKSNNLKQLSWYDGSLQFRVQLKKDKGRTFNIIFNEDGSIACQ